MYAEAVKGKKSLSILKGILLAAGILMFLYYLVIVGKLGFRLDFSIIWLVGTLVCLFLIGVLTKAAAIEKIIWGVLVVGLLLFGLLEGVIIKAGFECPDTGADYVIVLGAHVRGTTITKALRYRLDAAYGYLTENQETKVIVSGGQGKGEDISEAKAMHDYLVKRGISEDRILMEDKSTNTNENLLYSKKLLGKADSVVVVTNRFHLYRAKKLASKQLDKKVMGLGAETGTVLFINYYVREVFATVKDKVFHNI